jgi:ribonucleoside-diphosphate reductase alpha subunit
MTDISSATPPTDEIEMFVTKRNGEREKVSFDKILARIRRLGTMPELADGESIPMSLAVNYTNLVIKVIDQLYDGINTSQIDELVAEQCAALSTTHPDYGILASRIVVSNHHKNTSANFAKNIRQLYEFTDVHGKHSPLVAEDFNTLVQRHAETFNSMIDDSRDYMIDYFGFKTLERSYLMKISGATVERPQHMFMRVAVAIHGDDLERVKTSYDMMSQRKFIHATPTLFNAGTPHPQLSSCYLIGMEADSIDGIYNTLGDCARISKWAGGIGLHIHNVRAEGSLIRGTNGKGTGIVPMLRVFNATARYVNQGGKRNGSIAIYLEPWHADIEKFLQMRKNHGDEEMRARDLFYALWIPDLFMRRVKANDTWTLMCPDECPGLAEVYGDEFDALYERYERAGRGRRTVKARDIWYMMLDSQIETGTPYMLYKDAANKKSNQKNLGTIKSSNLCTEIIEYSDDKETAVCNLASLSLPAFVRFPRGAEAIAALVPESVRGDGNGYGDADDCATSPSLTITMYARSDCKYCKMAKDLLRRMEVRFVEEVLDDMDTRKARLAELATEWKQPTAFTTLPQMMLTYTAEDKQYTEYIGGYTDLRRRVKLVYDYEALHSTTKVVTRNLNRVIDINFYPTEKTRLSNMRHRPIGMGVQGLADVFAMMGEAFDSPRAREINRHIAETMYHAAVEASVDLAKEDGAYSTFAGSPMSRGEFQFEMWGITPTTGRYDWDELRRNVVEHGVRNSLLLAPMPTASTSQILGNNECFEPFTSNIYLRRTLAGEFVVINRYLMRELLNRGLWNEELKNNIIANKGSIQHLEHLPEEIRMRYRTVWEIPMRSVIEMSRDRGAFICQSQSMNLWMENATYDKLTAMHFFAWSQGLKTGLYYLRTKAKAAPQQFTIDPSQIRIVDRANSGAGAGAGAPENDTQEPEECLMCSA